MAVTLNRLTLSPNQSHHLTKADYINKKKIKVRQEIRKQAAIQGLSSVDQDTVASQISVSSTTYLPMHCSTVNAAASDLVTYKEFVSSCANPEAQQLTTPYILEFTTYQGTITISNAMLAGWNTQKWNALLSGVVQQLTQMSPYGAMFASSVITSP
ncbi:hypothetical protein GCK32_013858 [Trichostrongylus colubriformis]|uniref:Uncharacterized protein n=1 Tax=Trichostrongylus colubriformis TaxID=6319 RepID=A0AAN8IFA1_TRICO